MTKSENIALVLLSFSCLVLVWSQGLTEHPSDYASIDTTATGADFDEGIQPSAIVNDLTRGRQSSSKPPSELSAEASGSSADKPTGTGSRHTVPTGKGSARTVSASGSSWHAHRHVDHIFNTSSNLQQVAFRESEYFTTQLFQKYGTPTVLPFPALKKLMTNLGMITSNEVTKSMADQPGQMVTGEKAPARTKKRRSVTHVHSDHSEVSDSSPLHKNTDHNDFVGHCPHSKGLIALYKCARRYPQLTEQGRGGGTTHTYIRSILYHLRHIPTKAFIPVIPRLLQCQAKVK